MKLTKMQWCHSTVNPVMGCDGCESWKPSPPICGLVNEAEIPQDLVCLTDWCKASFVRKVEGNWCGGVAFTCGIQLN